MAGLLAWDNPDGLPAFAVALHVGADTTSLTAARQPRILTGFPFAAAGLFNWIDVEGLLPMQVSKHVARRCRARRARLQERESLK